MMLLDVAPPSPLDDVALIFGDLLPYVWILLVIAVAVVSIILFIVYMTRKVGERKTGQSIKEIQEKSEK